MAVWIGNLKAAQSIVGIFERLAKGRTNKTNSTGEDPALQKNNEKTGRDVSAAARHLRYRAPTGGPSPSRGQKQCLPRLILGEVILGGTDFGGTDFGLDKAVTTPVGFVL